MSKLDRLGKVMLFLLLFLCFGVTVCSYASEKKIYSINPNVKLSFSINNEKHEVSNINLDEMVVKVIQNMKKVGERGKSVPSCDEVRLYAEECGMLDETEYNPHLRFLGGDIAYWCEQGLSINRLIIEFCTRKIVLETADKDKFVINDQGTLSWAAQSITAGFLREIKKSK